jgi:pyrrolysine biosynthesis protein PylC
MDIVEDREDFLKFLKGKDMIIPAFEDGAALKVLEEIAELAGVPVFLDLDAYNISSSKLASDHLFAEHSIPAPKYWPNCNLPVIAKPSGLSGSSGVRLIENMLEMKKFLAEIAHEVNTWVIQEYVQGPSYSIEIIGHKNNYATLQTTEIVVDSMYDCQQVLAPVQISPETEQELRDLAVQIAQLVNLRGIMDLEVIATEKGLRVLEIDARFPSQTPITVYHSTGINMLEMLSEVFVEQNFVAEKYHALIAREPGEHVVFEHICVTPDGIETLGEHIMTVSGPLTLIKDFFGADEALTSYTQGREWWVATLIIKAATAADVKRKRAAVIAAIEEAFSCSWVG